MVTSEFVLLFLDIINMRVAFSCCYAYLTYDFLKGYRVEGEEGVASLMVWVSCGVHLILLSLRLMCLAASFGAESDSE